MHSINVELLKIQQELKNDPQSEDTYLKVLRHQLFENVFQFKDSCCVYLFIQINHNQPHIQNS